MGFSVNEPRDAQGRFTDGATVGEHMDAHSKGAKQALRELAAAYKHGEVIFGEPTDARSSVDKVHVVTSRFSDDAPTIEGVFHSRGAAEQHAASISTNENEDDAKQGVEIHSVPVNGTPPSGTGDRLHVLSGVRSNQVIVHGVFANQSEAKRAQNDILQHSWASHGRPLDYEDVWNNRKTENAWGDEIAQWNASHGTNIKDEGYQLGSHPDFERHFESKYMEGKIAPYPGANEANDYFENSGHEVFRHSVKVTRRRA